METIYVQSAYRKKLSTERYSEQHDFCNYFNMVEFHAAKVPEILEAYSFSPDKTVKFIEDIFERRATKWVFTESTPNEEGTEEIFLNKETLESIKAECVIRCIDLIEMNKPKLVEVTPKPKKVSEVSKPKLAALTQEPKKRIFDRQYEEGIGEFLQVHAIRSDGKKVRISQKYFKRYAYPPRYRYEDIQNDKIKEPFKHTRQKPYERICANKGSGDKICSAVLVQPLEKDGRNFKEKSYYAVEHFERGFELASERGTMDDETFMDIAQRTLIKELNMDFLEVIELKGKIVESGGSRIFIFHIDNFPKIQPYIPKDIQDKNIIGSKFVKYSELKPWSKFHINILNGAIKNEV